VRLGALSPDEIRAVRPGRSAGTPQLDNLVDDELLQRILGEDESPGEVASRIGLPEPEVGRRVVIALRRTMDSSETTELDDRIGAWLLAGGAYAQREQEAEALLRAGADPLDLDRLSVALKGERRARRRRRVRLGDMPPDGA
jgi:hypothetical protein